MTAPSPVTAAELEEALDVIRRAASHFAPSSYAGRVLQTARGVLLDLHRKLQAQERARLRASRLDDQPV